MPEPTKIDAVVKVGTDLLGSLKTSPSIVAIVILNVMFLGVTGFIMRERNVQRQEEVQLILDRCLPKGTSQ